MTEFIQYDLQGNVKLKTTFDFTRHSCHGQKTRITTTDGCQYIGFMNFTGKTMPGTLQPAENPSVFELQRFDIDSFTKKVRSNNLISIFIPLNITTRVEAILYSNPRWGRYPNNKFQLAAKESPEKQERREKFNHRFAQMLAKKGIKFRKLE